MMEIDGDDVLRRVAAGGSMEYSAWPALLPTIVTRIEKIAREEFPIPNLPPPAPLVLPSSIPRPAPSESDDAEGFLPPLPSSPTNPPSTTSSQDTNKENTPVATRTAPAPTSAPPAPPPEPLPPGTLPQQIRDMLTEITVTLTSTFPTYPPHTVQRLAELVLTPKHHYKSLPSYLHALDRVVHVTSGLNVYPLPPAVHDVSAAGVLSNGVSESTGPSPFANPGSDEALGGALLTPIPWLQPPGAGGNEGLSPQGQASGGEAQQSSTSPNSSSSSPTDGDRNGNGEAAELRTESTETIDGPNGMGSIETVTVTVNGVPSMGARGVGVTQGELLRQEQRAGVVPVSQLVPSHHAHIQQQQQQQQQQRRAAAASSSTPGAGPAGGDQAQGDSSASPAVTAAEQAVEDGEAVGSVAGADEDEKPHARGPEEIGAADTGPQREGSAATSYAGGLGVEMQGLDVEAAVGRKATSTRTTASSSEPAEASEGDGKKASSDADKMDGVEPTTAAARLVRSPTPKREREAEESLESVSKKLKGDTPPKSNAPAADAAEAAAPAAAEKAKEEKDEVDSEVKAGKQDQKPAESVDVEMKAEADAAATKAEGKGADEKEASSSSTSKDNETKEKGGSEESKLAKD